MERGGKEKKKENKSSHKKHIKEINTDKDSKERKKKTSRQQAYICSKFKKYQSAWLGFNIKYAVWQQELLL